MSTNELVLPAKDEVQREAEEGEAKAGRDRESQAAEGAALICDWLKEYGLTGAKCEQTIKKAQREDASGGLLLMVLKVGQSSSDILHHWESSKERPSKSLCFGGGGRFVQAGRLLEAVQEIGGTREGGKAGGTADFSVAQALVSIDPLHPRLSHSRA